MPSCRTRTAISRRSTSCRTTSSEDRVKLVVTGREGQIVRSLMERAGASAIEVLPVGRPEFDLAKPATIAQALTALRPDAIVNAAAYTAVDAAESDSAAAFAINGEGAGAVAAAA